MNFGYTRLRLVQTGAALSVAALVSGCGSQYRSVVTPVTSSGPASEVTSYAVVVSAPSTTTDGIATIFDYSGDTKMAQASLGVGPLSFSINETHSEGYTFNSDGTLTDFPISTSLLTKNVQYSTVPPSAEPVNMFTPSTGMWAADLNGNVVDYFTGSGLVTYSMPFSVAPIPVTAVGPAVAGARNYILSQNETGVSSGNTIAYGLACNQPSNFAGYITNSQYGEADGIDTSNNTISSRIPVGVCPVYGVQSSDARRVFVLNRGDDTITVINSTVNALDSCTPFKNLAGQTVNCHPTLPLSTNAITRTGIYPTGCNYVSDATCGGMPTTAGPVYAEYNATTDQLVVADYDSGTISVIDVSMDEYGYDSSTFGTTYTIPVCSATAGCSAYYPASVTMLYDGSKAYTANQGNGSVSVIDLAAYTLEKTLTVVGHPRTVVSTQNSDMGKVYVASPDSPYITIIQTGGIDPDTVDTSLLVEGNVIDVRVTTQNGSSGNTNVTSRTPGAGQPCNLPPSKFDPSGVTTTYATTIANCQAQSTTLLTN